MKINDLLSSVESMSKVMPEFQREYVWPIEDAKQLMISLYKEYPTGCLLFWSTENPPEIKNNAIDVERLGLTDVILDGQQRLTTLYLLIKGKIPPYYKQEDILNDPRHLYFNLLTSDFQYYTKNIMEANPLWQSVVDCFNIEMVNAVDVATTYIETATEHDFKAAITIINNNLNRLRSILERTYPILTVPKTATIDDAIEVFDRVNSQGTKLTDAELVLTHITGKWPHARRVMKDKIAQYSKIGFDFNLDFLTRCMVITLTRSALFNKNAKLKYEVFSKEEYIQAWEKVSKSLDYLIPILQQDGFINSTNDLSTNNVLVPIIAYLVDNNIRFKGRDRFKFLHWMFLAMMWSRYSGQTDQRLDKDVYILYNEQDPFQGLLNEIEDMRGRLEVRPADLEGRAAGHPLYKMLYVVTKQKKAIDWVNGGPIYGTIGPNLSIQSHHIFPQAYLYHEIYESENHLDRKKVNEIANRAFITRDTNFSIGASAPIAYLPEIEDQYPGALSKQFIPMKKDLWIAEKYEEFLGERRSIIADEINKFLENLLKREDKTIITVEKQQSWEEIIGNGENNFVEFKSTLCFCMHEKKRSPKVEHAIIKTLNAFLNSEGGRLFVGVDDAGNILGLDDDFRTLNKPNAKDAFLLKFDGLIKNHLGIENLADISTQFIKINGKDVFVVDVAASTQPIFLKNEGKEEFYVRGSASSQPYGMRESSEYIKRHWANS